MDERRPQATGNIDVGSVHDMTAEEMVSLIAHEIRNHLAVIQGFGTELGKSWQRLSEVTKEDSVRRMTERARYLNTVVGNLLYMRRIEAGVAWQEAAVADLFELLRPLVGELTDLTQEVRVELEAEPGRYFVHVDPQRLRQILTNLVLNAGRFAPGDSPVVLAVAARGDSICLEVRDEGPGIPVDRRAEIFERFTRLQEGGAGIGIGLFISRELARSMDGDLWVEDHPAGGSGATFVCSFPAAEGQ